MLCKRVNLHRYLYPRFCFLILVSSSLLSSMVFDSVFLLLPTTASEIGKSQVQAQNPQNLPSINKLIQNFMLIQLKPFLHLENKNYPSKRTIHNTEMTYIRFQALGKGWLSDRVRVGRSIRCGGEVWGSVSSGESSWFLWPEKCSGPPIIDQIRKCFFFHNPLNSELLTFNLVKLHRWRVVPEPLPLSWSNWQCDS